MKKFCAFLLMTLMALSTLSCEEEQFIPLTPEDITPSQDGSLTSMSFSFLEYARVFPVEIPDNIVIKASVPDECAGWISTKLGQSLDGAGTKYTLFILLSENVGNKERNGVININNISTGKDLTISVSQIGSEMEGSFKKALLDFYNALDGKNWFKRAGDDDDRELHWNKDMQIIDFYGLFPSRTAVASSVDPKYSGNVYFGTEEEWEIGLPFNGLKGTIPESFWNACKYFTYIKINNCYLQNSRLSDKVWHEKLLGVNFSHTYIGGEITQAVANAKNLELIKFYKCHISGRLPESISTLGKLSTIDFSLCDLSGGLPDNIGELSNLRVLDLSGNVNLKGVLPESFYNLKHLRDFFAGTTQLGGTLSSRIGEMTDLHYFFIDDCEFEGNIPEELGTLSRFVFSGTNNYFTEIPEFVRYSGCENRWILLGGTFPDGVPSYQRKKETGRPKDMYIFDFTRLDEMTINSYSDLSPCVQINVSKYIYHLPLPIWAHIRYNIIGWQKYVAGTKVNKPEWPDAEDLQYPANEYYYDKDRKAWCHPNLEYPAREYYRDTNGNWVHDASCPWDQPYVYDQ